MKRSLVIWPLAASLLVVGLCWLSLQSDPGSRLLVAQASQFWSSLGERMPGRSERIGLPAVRNVRANVSNRPGSIKPVAVNSSGSGTASTNAAALTVSSNGDAPRRDHQSSGGATWTNPAAAQLNSDLANIQAWNDTSLELSGPVLAGIPAPMLDLHSDLFGFDASPSTPAAEVDPNAYAATESARENELVIRINPDLFFQHDQPLSQNQNLAPLNADTPRMAERPTSDLAWPSVYQAPDAVVADLIAIADVANSRSPLDDTLGLSLGHEIVKRTLPAATEEESSSVSDQPQIDESSRGEDVDSGDSLATGRPLAQPRSAAWPVPHRLLEQLDLLDTIVGNTELNEIDAIESSLQIATGDGSQDLPSARLLDWSKQVRALLNGLHAANRLGDAGVERMLSELDVAQQFAAEQAEKLTSRSRRVAWLQAAYSIERRLAVWYPVYRINSGAFPAIQHVGDDVPSVSHAMDQLNAKLATTGDAQGWATFLLLQPLGEAFASGDDNARRELAQRFLSRLSWPNLAETHQLLLADQAVTQVAAAVRPWATGAIDYSALLHQIERAESNAIDLVTAEVAQSMQALEHASHPEAKQLATNLDMHYRNANIRFSLSEELLNSLMPELPTRDVPVRTTLLGSRVTGVSRVSSDLRVRLHPSPSTWELTLETMGNVSTQSIGRSGPAAINTSSMNPYNASTPISIKPTDIQLGSAAVSVGGRSRLRSIDTTYDSWPLIGSLVNGFAESQYFDKASLADRIGKSRIRTELGSEIDRTVNEKVDSASTQFSKVVLGPLTEMQLEPRVIDMNSTSTRLNARYRMAGDWQLAAMTPRPRALSDNLFSVQMHQSAINNTLEQMIPQADAMPIEQVLQQCYDAIGASDRLLPEDLPADTEIQFAKHRPITVEIEDGKVWITMRIIRLQSEDHLRLRNFIVRASYVAQVNGLSAELVREGVLNISGPGMSMRQRLPVRAIFNKVLSPTRAITLTSPDLLAARLPEQSGITQFELRDGWIGISVGKIVPHQQVATRPAGIR